MFASQLETKKNGFTLVEIIVTISIILFMIIMYQAVITSTLLARTVRNKDLALKIASQKMEGLRALGYTGVPVSGSFSDPLLTNLPAGAGAISVVDYNAKTKQVTVTVSWSDQVAGSKSVALDTLITQVGSFR